MLSEEQIVDVSVVVVTYNRDRPLQRTLDCLLKQNPAPREIIVVDQSHNHEEGTRLFLEEAKSRHLIRYIFQPEPNAQKARNRAIVEAVGEVLLFVDDDVVMDHTLVGSHWRNYGDVELSAVCGYYLEPGDEPTDRLDRGNNGSIAAAIHFPHSYTTRTECHILPTCNGSIRRGAILQLGGFDENYTYTHLDDTDLGCRLKKLGLKSVHDPEARLIHLKVPSGGKRPGALNEYVIADSNQWYTWWYFFWMNFGVRGLREIGSRLRTCVFRRKNIVRPLHLVSALWQFFKGGARAVVAIRSGRKLMVTPSDMNVQLDRRPVSKLFADEL